MKATSTMQPDLHLDRGTAAMWASWFSALGDPTRVLILRLLSTERRPMSVGDITDRLDVGQSTVSHHLATLADVGFVLVERVGTSSWWRVNDRCIDCFPSAAEMVMGQVPADFRSALGAPPTTGRTTGRTTRRTTRRTTGRPT